MQRWILKSNCYFNSILWFSQSKVHDSYIERSNLYDYDDTINFLSIHWEFELSSIFVEQRIEVNLVDLIWFDLILENHRKR